MKFSKVFLIGLCFVLSWTVSAQSQLGAGAIRGTVQDINGAAIAGAAVTVINEETNLTRNLTTNDDGLFVAPVLPIGNYTIRVEQAGFSDLERTNLKVNVGNSTALRLTLQTGAVSEVVIVESSPIIDTVKTDESTLINRMQINDLPINGRRADQFALLAPGVTRDGRFGLLSYRGQSGIFNNFTLEGNDDNQAYFSEAAGRTRIASNISANAVQEFEVAVSNFLPEFGRSAGGGINAVVRSGGNEFHGDGFWYFRNKSLNARDPLSTTNPDERRDQFGGSFSGPIVKDKLFFFFNYDQQLRDFPLVTEDLSGVLTSGLPSNASAADHAAFALGTADLQARFPGGSPGNALPRRFDQNLVLAKFDWLINNANTFSLTYNYLNARNPNGIQTSAILGNVGRNGSDDVRINTLNGRLTTIFNPKVVNEFRFQVKRDFEFEFGNEPPPQVFVGGFSFGRANFLERPALPDERRYQIVDNINYIFGNHAVKIGGEINHVRDEINNPRNFGGTYSYSNALTYGRDLIAIANGTQARNYSRFTQSFGIPGLTFSTTDFAAFIQDQWRVRKNLTINYGLRYDLQRLPGPVAPNPDIPETTVINQSNNYGPRIGVAWDIFGNQKNLIRGGYGIYYGRIPNGLIFNALTNTGLRDPQTGLPDLANTVVSISVSPTTNGAPVFPDIFSQFPSQLSSSTSVFRLDPNFKNPRLQEVNIGYEREIINNLSISASYVYTKGDRLPVTFDTNLPAPAFTRDYQLPDGTIFTTPFGAGVTCTIVPTSGSCPAANRVNVNASRPDPNFSSIELQRSIGETYYNALFFEVKRRFAQGFQFNIAYTLAKAENLSGTGNGSGSGSESPFGGSDLFNQFDNSTNRAAAPTDQRHRFVFNGIWQLPKVESESKFVRALLNGYQLSGIFTGESGRPYSANISIPTISFVQNGQIFTPFGGGTVGIGGLSLAPNIERNSIYGEANYRTDLRLSRKFSITEKVQVELIGEGFNIFNRANFNGFNTTLFDTITPSPNPPAFGTPILLRQRDNFGEPNADGSQPDGTNARRFQLAARFRF